jgi:putative GTP pyrophosphokinase
MTEAAQEYRRRYDAFLQRIATKLEKYLREDLAAVPHIDRINARAKDPQRFAEKASRLDEEGKPKYTSPLTEIQDQIGARVIVFYRDDVAVVRKTIDRYFQHIEAKELVPDSYWEFGYFGQHLLLPLPGDVIPKDIERNAAPRFFELQIKTLFQHAWSEANHDLGYKAPRPLSQDEQRWLAYTAAQAWGADRVFNELRDEI